MMFLGGISVQKHHRTYPSPDLGDGKGWGIEILQMDQIFLEFQFKMSDGQNIY